MSRSLLFSPSALIAAFALIFLGELPDKTMFASLALSSKGRPLAVWAGAATAFAVHVAIAVTVGVSVFRLLPSRAVDFVAAALFAFGAIWAWRAREDKEEEHEVQEALSHRRTFITAAVVIFIAEWGDLTQVLIANLSFRYHSALSVAVGSYAALITVAGAAVFAGPRLAARLPVRTARITAAVVLMALAVVSAVQGFI